MYTHPEILLNLAKQRQSELIEDARRFRRRHKVPQEHRARPGPRSHREPAHSSRPEINVGPAGTLSVCETPRELTAGRAR
jgi:hypothetical protein